MAEDKGDIAEDNSSALLVGLKDDQFYDIAYFLTYGESPKHITTKVEIKLRLKATKYTIIDNVLYKKGLDGAFLRCVDKDQHKKLLNSLHNEAFGDNFSFTMSSFKIMRNRLQWPGMFVDAYKWVGKYEKCKLFSGKPRLVAPPLKPMVVKEQFKQWGLEFIGPLNPTSGAGHTHVQKTMDYFTKWVEEIPIKNTTS